MPIDAHVAVSEHDRSCLADLSMYEIGDLQVRPADAAHRQRARCPARAVTIRARVIGKPHRSSGGDAENDLQRGMVLVGEGPEISSRPGRPVQRFQQRDCRLITETAGDGRRANRMTAQDRPIRYAQAEIE